MAKVDDVDDLDERVREMRKWAISDGSVAQGIRMFDGIAELMVEMIRELRKLNQNLERKRDQNA